MSTFYRIVISDTVIAYLSRLPNSSLGIVYELKESFFTLWDSDSRQKAYFKYYAWKAKVPKELHTAFEPLMIYTHLTDEEMLQKLWLTGKKRYFDHRVTNAYTESLNSLIRVINRLGRGYSFRIPTSQNTLYRGACKAT